MKLWYHKINIIFIIFLSSLFDITKTILRTKKIHVFFLWHLYHKINIICDITKFDFVISQNLYFAFTNSIV